MRSGSLCAVGAAILTNDWMGLSAVDSAYGASAPRSGLSRRVRNAVCPAAPAPNAVGAACMAARDQGAIRTGPTQRAPASGRHKKAPLEGSWREAPERCSRKRCNCRRRSGKRRLADARCAPLRGMRSTEVCGESGVRSPFAAGAEASAFEAPPKNRRRGFSSLRRAFYSSAASSGGS